jgi:hypothetical protein
MVSKAYKPIEVFDCEGNPDVSMKWLLDPNNIFHALLSCSIRTAVEAWNSVWEAPKGYDDNYLKDQALLEQNMRKRKEFPSPQKLITSNTEAQLQQWYPPNSQEVQLLLKNIALFDPIQKRYSNLSPSSLKRSGKTVYWLELNAQDPSSYYCLKCDKDHKSRTRFKIDPQNIEQQSWSNNTDTCGSKIMKIALDIDIRDLLFGKSVSSISLQESFIDPLKFSLDLNLSVNLSRPSFSDMLVEKKKIDFEIKKPISLSSENAKLRKELEYLINEKSKHYHESASRDNSKNKATKRFQNNNLFNNRISTPSKTSQFQSLIDGKKPIKPKDSMFQNITIYKDQNSLEQNKKNKKEIQDATPLWVSKK